MDIATEFRFPDVGEGINEGTIVKWHVKEGDPVKADQVLAEIETDKAIVEMPSPSSGTVLKVGFKEGDVVKVGEVLVVIGAAGESAAAAEPATPRPKTTKPKTPEPGAARPAPLAAQPGTTKPETPGPRTPLPAGRVLATPATRKHAREMGMDITKVEGTGPGGRITEGDLARAKGAGPGTAKPETPGPGTSGTETAGAGAVISGRTASPPMPVASEEGDKHVPLTRLRKVIAERMTYSKTHIPHACGMDFVDITKLSIVREKEKKNFASKGVKLTYLSFIVKACAIALKEFPRFNANFDEGAGELVIRAKHNIGIAVNTPEGLMVPVIKDVDRRSIIEIAQEIEHLAAKAKERKLTLDEIRGGTFSITNVGSVGGMYSTPIINPPEIAIMGVHRIKEMPTMVGGKVKPRKIMGISLCFDHRVADGAEATEFMNTVMRHLEDPDLMLVDMI
ncbi:MAG: dihydrolipoamide acetyltransferase family protein [Candidatus Micrarchaeota archaeon]